MPWPKTGATQYHAQIGLPDKGRNILNLGEKNIMKAYKIVKGSCEFDNKINECCHLYNWQKYSHFVFDRKLVWFCQFQ